MSKSDKIDCPTCERSDLDGVFGLISHHIQLHPDEFEDRFWVRVDRAKEDECWEWQGSLDSSGYGNLSESGKQGAAHRQAWELEHGNPGDDWVLHTCDNKKCVNPNHLYLGDHTQNMADAWDRGLMTPNNNLPPIEERGGEDAPGAKLSKKEAQEVKEMIGDKTQEEIAIEYGITQTTVSQIKLGQTWECLEE